MKNQTLAHVHSSNRKLVAYCIAKASLLALIVNAAVIPAGLVCVVLMLDLPWQQKILPIALLVPIGILLAIVVDGMTMGSCARLRKTFEDRLAIKNRYALIQNKEKEIEDQEETELGALQPSINLNTTFIVVFTMISVGAGELFWHTLLSSLPNWIAWTLSTLFSFAVSACLIASELLKLQNETIIEESISSVKFHKLAVVADAEEEAIDNLQKEFSDQVEKIAKNSMMRRIVEEKVRDVYNDLLFDGENRVSGLIEADRVAKENAEKRRLARVKDQMELLPPHNSNEKNTGPIERIGAPKFKKLGNAEKVAEAVEKYGEPYVRQNIDLISSELGMHKSTIYTHLRSSSVRDNSR